MIVKFEDALLKQLQKHLSVTIHCDLPKGRKQSGQLNVIITFKGDIVAASHSVLKAPSPF